MVTPPILVVIDGSFESLLTVVFRHFYEKLQPTDIVQNGQYQFVLCASYMEVVSDQQKAMRVLAGIRKKFTIPMQNCLELAINNNDPSRFMPIFEYIVSAFRIGVAFHNRLDIDCVLLVQKLAKAVAGEIHHYSGFLRFEKTKDGFFYAKIRPKHFVLQGLAQYFVDRMPDEGFVIHDLLRNLAVVYNGEQWVMVETPLSAKFELASSEEEFQALWQTFHQAIAISSRQNKKNQRNNLPLRYRNEMPEFLLRF